MFEISLRIQRSQTLACEILLEEMDALSINLENAEDTPIFVEQVGSTPLWQNITLTALFTDDINILSLQNRLEEVLETAIEIKQREIQTQDWQRSWIQNFPPEQFGERLWVCPSWTTYPDPFAINIRLDPGMAFGTGTHGTTALCLQWLAKHSLINKTVIDFGCGSGILAIAAYYLGAKNVYAIDHDPQAIQATNLNAAKNGVDMTRLHISLSNKPAKQTCDVLIANLLLTPLIELAPRFAKILLPDGNIILSGILEQQLEELKAVYQSYFTIDAIHTKNEWLLIEASPKK
ncbi:MAG: 50S ribosomal protein L11 methyltransferase [Pseudomonadota bacterium]